MKTLMIAPLFAAAVLLGVALSSRAAENAAAPDIKVQRQQWQHLALPQQADDALTEISAKINELGRQGWELVTVADDRPGTLRAGKTYYFKRPL